MGSVSSIPSSAAAATQSTNIPSNAAVAVLERFDEAAIEQTPSFANVWLQNGIKTGFCKSARDGWFM